MSKGLLHSVERRTFLRQSSGLVGGLASVSILGACSTVPAGIEKKAAVLPSVPAPRPEPHSKSFKLREPDSGDVLEVTFKQGRDYDRNALREIDYFLRDRHVDMMVEMDINLVELIHDLQHELGSPEPITVLSAYRTPQTNRRLRTRGIRAARNSLHMRGMAMDIRLHGKHASALRKVAMELTRGGVGYYPRQNFIHVDTGPVRAWRR